MLVRYFRKCASRRALRIGRYNLSLLVLAIAVAGPASAAIVWDGEADTQWWFDPENWDAAMNSNTVLPPSNNTTGIITATDTQINLGTGAWNLGEGVVFDPTNDPNFADVSNITFPSGFGPQIINGLFMSRGTMESTLLTIKGDLTFRDSVEVGSASGDRGSVTQGTIIQESGLVNIPSDNLVLATVNTSSKGRGNGTYDYRGGALRVAQEGGFGLRLSVGDNDFAIDGEKAGPGGIGKFIVHNPATAGYIRTYNLWTVFFAGFDEGIQNNPNDSEFNAAFDADGETTGVGIFEFHYANGGTRPIQVNNNMYLNNGLDNNTKGTRSSRLDLVLDEAPCDVVGCIPGNIGLFDVGFDGSGSLQGSGDLNGNGNFTDDRVFSSLSGTTHYREGNIVSAVFGSTRYDWMISYTGDINWSNANNSEISSITGMGTGNDIVLIGVGSADGIPGDFDGDGDVDGRDFLAWQRDPNIGSLSDWQNYYGMPGPLASVGAVPEPTGLVLLCAVALPLFARRP